MKRASVLTLIAILQMLSNSTFGATLSVSPAEQDQAIPRSNSQIDEDAIQVEMNTRTSVSDKDAQNRSRPKEEESYTRIVPFSHSRDKPILQKRLKNGTKVYAVKPSPQKYSGGFRVGPYNPSNLEGTQAGVTYKNIYGNNSAMLADFNFEYQLFDSVGKLGLRTDFGFFTAKGQGRFKNDVASQADEIMTLIGIPVGLSAVYHAQYWYKQPVVPFAEGGIDYFTIFEVRGDKKTLSDSVKYGGSPAAHFAAGVQIMLDALDKEVLWQLDNEYGINHIYLTGDVRQIVALGGTFDFSSLVYEGGILFEF